MGGIKAGEVDAEATNALIVMACGLQKPWFLPTAYSFYELSQRPNSETISL